MAFCTACGAELGAGHKFCAKCGASAPAAARPVATPAVSAPVAATPQTTPATALPQDQQPPQGALHPAHNTVRGCVIAGMVVYAMAAALSLLAKDLVGLVSCALILVALYFFGYEALKKREYAAVRTACMGIGIAAIVFLVLSLSQKNGVAVLVDAAVAALMFYPWYQLRK